MSALSTQRAHRRFRIGRSLYIEKTKLETSRIARVVAHAEGAQFLPESSEQLSSFQTKKGGCALIKKKKWGGTFFGILWKPPAGFLALLVRGSAAWGKATTSVRGT